MELIKSPGLPLQGNFRYPNVIVFPRELRDAIPVEYEARALEFDSVSGSHVSHPLSPMPIRAKAGEAPVASGRRARIEFPVHESGKLDGRFSLIADLDIGTKRALGQFLIDLANRAVTQG